MAMTSVPLSGSTVYGAITIIHGGSPGTTIHSTGTSAAVIDEITLFAANYANDAEYTVYIEWPGSGQFATVVPISSGLVPVVAGLRLSGTGSAQTVKAFTTPSGSSKVQIYGFVTRIS